MTRRLALTLLLRSLHDLDYDPPTWTGQLVQRQSRSGEGPSARIACHTCRGEGAVRKRGVPFLCDVCQGRGWVVVDAYTQRMIGTAETGTIHHKTALRCDACSGNGAHGNGQRCERCGGSGWQEVPTSRLTAAKAPLAADAPELGPGDPVIACLERRQKAGDFERLGFALAALRLDYRMRYRIVVRVFVVAEVEEEQLLIDEALRLGKGLDYLLGLMPDEIRVPVWAARNERRRREQLKRKVVAA